MHFGFAGILGGFQVLLGNMKMKIAPVVFDARRSQIVEFNLSSQTDDKLF